MQLTLVDGNPNGFVPITDRGLAYGDGIFETIAVENSQLCLWKLHCKRIKKGCKVLRIPFDDYSILEQEAKHLAQTVEHGVVKVIITAGSGSRGYRRPDVTKPLRIVSAYPSDKRDNKVLFEQGIRATVSETRLAYQSAWQGIKHLNRLEQVTARMEWQDEWQEAVMLDEEGFVREGTMSNLFILNMAGLSTPRLQHCGVCGVMREWIMEQSQQVGISVEEVDINLDELINSNGFFFCNSIIKAWPVKQLDQYHYDISEVKDFLKQLPWSEDSR